MGIEIRDVRAICTAPEGVNLVAVKIETSEPGLYGVDMALWDIKGKLAGMPLYQLFGGKCRPGVPCYTHAEGADAEQTLERVEALRERGYRKIRVQVGGYGG